MLEIQQLLVIHVLQSTNIFSVWVDIFRKLSAWATVWETLERTFERFGDEVCSRLGLLYVVALHDLTFFVETQVPGSAWLLLPIDHWWVGHVIVLKHGLFKFALWREVLLWELNGLGRQQKNNQRGESERGKEQYLCVCVCVCGQVFA